MDTKPDLAAEEFEQTLGEQIRRLRRMLVLMAPETGSPALGARCVWRAERRDHELPTALVNRPR